MKKNKSKNKRVPKYEFGTLIGNPQADLYENQIAMVNAARKAGNNGWVKGLKIFGNLAQQVGTSMMQKGMANGEGDDGKGIAGFLNNNYGDISSGMSMLSGFANSGGFAFGGNVPGLTPVEVEGKEVGETPDGQLINFEGPSHENGGINIALPPGTEMYSKRIKVDGVSMADRKKKRERKTLTLEQLFDKNKTDALLKNSLSRTKENNEFEEQADNKIQMLVKTLMEQPKQSHAYGGGVDGKDPYDSILYGKKDDGSAFQLNDFKKYLDAFRTYSNKPNPGAWYNQDDRKLMQTEVRKMLGENTTGVDDGIFGKNDYAVFDKWYNSVYLPKNNGVDPNLITDNVDRGQADSLGLSAKENLPNNPNIDYAGIEKFFGGLPISDDASLSEVTNRPYSATPDGEEGFSLKGILGDVTIGDALGIAGNLYQSNKIMDTVLANRAGDTPNINAFENYGKEGLKTLDETKQYVNQVRDEVLKDLQLDRTSSIKRNRNSARSVNTQRALDLATDASINNTKEKTYSSFAEQMMSILGNEASMKNNIDSVVMEGEQKRDLADRMDRDNYYNQLITGHKNIGKTMSQTGTDLNEIKKRKVSMNAINNLSEYVKMNDNGKLENQPGVEFKGTSVYKDGKLQRELTDKEIIELYKKGMLKN